MHRKWLTWAGLGLFGLAIWATPLRADDPPADRAERIAQLEDQMHKHYEAKKYREAMQCAEQILELAPDDHRTMYNLGCLHALRGEETQAFEWLSRAIDKGFRERSQLERDSDLNSLRDDPRWNDLMRHLARADDEDEPGDSGPRPGRAGPPPGPAGPRRGGDLSDLSPEKRNEVNRLTQQLVRAAADGDYEKGLELAEKAHAIAPGFWLTNYNMACMHAKLDHRREALDYFDRAVDAGMTDRKQIDGDSDLDPIRDDPRFRRALERMGRPGNDDDAPPPPRPGRPGPPPDEPEQIGPHSALEWNLTLPSEPGRGRAMPLIIALHDEGENIRMATEAWEEAAERIGAALLVPQGPIEAGRDRFDWGPSFQAVEQRVMEALAAADKRLDGVDRRHICLVGFGSGGRAAVALATLHPDKFCGAVSACGKFRRTDANRAGSQPLDGMRIYLMAGEDAPGYDSQKALAKALKKAGAKVELKELDDDGMEDARKTGRQADALKHALKGSSRGHGDDDRDRDRRRRDDDDDD